MSVIDLAAELHASVDAVRQQHLDRIRGLGVSLETIAAIGMAHPPFGVVEAELAADGTYQPGAGPTCIAQPVYIDGDLVDLVAWRSLRPARWYVRTGAAWALGLDNLGNYEPEIPFFIAATPLEWLQQGARGLCVLDWAAPELRRLIDLERIEITDQRFGAMLIARISAPPRLPKITYRGAANAA